MASSGNFEKKISGGSYGGYYIGVDWKIDSQSTSGTGSSVITASTYVRSSGNGYQIDSSSQKDISITVNGTKRTRTNTIGIGVNKKKILMTETFTVGHNSDGTKTCSFAGTFYVGFTLGGTSLKTVEITGSATLDKINLNSPPSLSGNLNLSTSGTIPENTGSVVVSWNKAGDSQNNANRYVVERFVNGTLNKTYTINNINTLSHTDDISGFGEGTSIYFQLFAYDSFGAMSNGLKSSTITKNRFTGANFTGHSNDVNIDTTSFSLYVNNASNTNGNTSFQYYYYSDDITIYGASNTTNKTGVVNIWRDLVGGSQPSGMYIKQSDLKNKLSSSSFNGRLHVGVRTTNAYGTQRWSGGSIGVDLRKEPTPATPVISEDQALSTAYKTVAATGNKYYLPNGTDKIRIQWSGASDVLGQAIRYDLQVKLGNGAFETRATDTTATTYDLVLPKQTSRQQLVARVITKTSYGYNKSKDAPAKNIDYYNAPSVDVITVDRTDTTATATIKLKHNTSIPNINFVGRYTGVSSGSLRNTTDNQDITASGLAGNRTYSWNVYVKDNAFTSTEQTKAISIGQYTPLFSVREKGVGVNAIPDGTAALIVNDGAKIGGNLTVNGNTKINGGFGQYAGSVSNFNDCLSEAEYTVGSSETIPNAPYTSNIYGKLTVKVSDGGTHNNSTNWIWQYFRDTSGRYYRRNKTNNGSWSSWSKDLTGADIVSGNTNLYGKIMRIGTDGVMEAGKYLDFHDGNNGQDYSARMACYGDKIEVSGQFQANSLLNMAGRGHLANIAGSWLHGATNASLLTHRLSEGSYHPLVCQTTFSNHKISLGGIGDKFGFYLYDKNRTANGVDAEFRFDLSNKAFYTNCESRFGRRAHFEEWIYTKNGLYFPDFNGGWFMQDSSWIRSYGDKGIYTAGEIKTLGTMTARYVQSPNGNLDLLSKGNTIYIGVDAASGANCNMNRTWAGSQGSEFSMYNNKGNGWGFIGNTNNKFFRVYGAGGSTSDRDLKYEITRASTEEQYENVKALGLYNYRSLSTENDDDTNEVVKTFKRQDLFLGTMVDELPLETTFYDNESQAGGDKTVDMYSYTSMILGALQETMKKVEALQQENEELKLRMEALENGITN